ncbi:hypothetical protein L2729_19240 [Shewanella gelidimarina]|uniref:hypothetical protein n=1 Tax=Shewanella gelidimarina TaxID=56813 RepID=UPI00200CFC06|nr:hypothetical protein [Shewanella gelidimarina]MCL1060109.1 hypothetical protein [Shewanella gelidimarina]
MNYKLFSVLLTGALMTTACGSDDNDTVTPVDPVTPPVVVVPTTIDVAKAATIELELASFDGVSGALSFSLSDADQMAITNAKEYRIVYFGFPDHDDPSTKAKAWKRWHLSKSYQCGSEASECEGLLTETATKGSYTFEAPGLDWSSDATPDAVQKYKVAIEIKGALSSNDLEVLPPPAV